MTQPDPSAQSGAAGTQSGTEGQPGTTPVTTPPPADPATQSGQQPPVTVDRAEYEALQRRMQASDRNNTDLQAKLKAIEDAKLTEEQKTANALTEAQKALADKDKAIADLELQLAFVSDNTYAWHDPKVAMQILDRTKVEMKDGKPTNVKDLLAELATSHAYLVKPAEAATTTPPAPTGLPMNNGTTPGKIPARTLEDTFPALRGRVPKRG